jgi:hypothetical protein
MPAIEMAPEPYGGERSASKRAVRPPLTQVARTVTELVRYRHRLRHVPTLAQVRAMAQLDGWEPCSYLLDRTANYVPAADEMPAPWRTRSAARRCASAAGCPRGAPASWSCSRPATASTSSRRRPGRQSPSDPQPVPPLASRPPLLGLAVGTQGGRGFSQ